MNTRSVVVAVASVLALSAATAQASVVLRCGGGTVQTDGFIINAQGEVVFAENSIACNVQQTGLPNPLALSIVDPAAGTTINVGDAPQNVQFSANITNYTQGVDTCRVTVQPPAPSAAWPAVTLNPVAGVATANIQFPQGLVAGQYNLQLACDRVSNNQQVLVPSVNRPITVQSSTAPIACTSFPIPSIFEMVSQANFTDPYVGSFTDPGSGGFGVQPNQTSTWRYWGFQNRFVNNQLDRLQLKTWVFRPTANTRGLFYKGNIGTSTVALSISDCPGKFLEIPAQCRGTGSIAWSTFASDTPPATNRCILDPTRDYIVSAATFNITTFVNSGGTTYQPASTCAGSPCTTSELYQVEHRVN